MGRKKTGGGHTAVPTAEAFDALAARVAALEEAAVQPPEPGPDHPIQHGSSVWFASDTYASTAEAIGPLGSVRIFDDGNGWGRVAERVAQVPTDVDLVLSSKHDTGYLACLNDAVASRTGGARVFACWMHEPDGKINKGELDRGEYIERTRDFCDNVHDDCPGVLTTQILMSYSYQDDQLHRDHPSLFQPDVCDVYGIDYYTWSVPNLVPRPEMQRFVDHARGDGRPWLVGEWGYNIARGGTSEQRAEWYADTSAWYAEQDDCLTVCYFNADVGGDFKLTGAGKEGYEPERAVLRAHAQQL